jgi:hypothetical protein
MNFSCATKGLTDHFAHSSLFTATNELCQLLILRQITEVQRPVGGQGALLQSPDQPWVSGPQNLLHVADVPAARANSSYPCDLSPHIYVFSLRQVCRTFDPAAFAHIGKRSLLKIRFKA